MTPYLTLNERTAAFFVFMLVTVVVAGVVRRDDGTRFLQQRRSVVTFLVLAAVGSWALGHNWVPRPDYGMPRIVVGNFVVAFLTALFVKGADDTGRLTWSRTWTTAAWMFVTLTALDLIPLVVR